MYGLLISVVVVVGLLLVVIFWVIVTYNRLVTLAKKRDESWSGVRVQLKRRHDLVPNLVSVVKGYAAHESKVLEEVTKMRSFGQSGGPKETGESERAFSQSLVRLLAVAENYPELKADRNFQELQNTLVRIEDDIQMSRRYYNGTVRDYNIQCATFPGVLIASSYSFRESPFFDLDSPSEAETPTVSFT